ncbi:MAG: hypothetical protein V4726_03710 [Verrucomicrobiota bacterium]
MTESGPILRSLRRHSLFLIFLAGSPLNADASTGSGFPQESAGKSLLFGQIGLEVEKEYTGDALGITPQPEGAWLRTDFQKLEGQATDAGLWVSSTAEPGEDGKPEGPEEAAAAFNPPEGGRDPAAQRFRVLATGVGRQGPDGGRFAAFPLTGQVATPGKNLVTFQRPGLVEEYRVGVDGVRQDFVVLERPAGAGELSLLLSVSGARAMAADYGAMLTLTGNGREIAYSRLRVSDAGGRVLTARLEVTAPDALRVVVDDAGAAYPVRIDPTFSDADWVAVNAGPNDVVRAVVVKGSTIFVAGDFTRAGTVSAQRITRWTGTNWFAMGTGMNGPVLALALSGTDLFAGGSFSTAGGASANRIAKWDNTSWSDVGGGIGGTNPVVRTLAARGPDVYAGGSFSSAGGVTTQNIAKWTGATSKWSALGAGVSGTVNALTFSQAILFAGGSFTAAGTVAASNFAKWNGNVWSAPGTGVNGAVLALTANGTDIYVGGSFSSAGGTPADSVARWDEQNKNWSPLGSGIEGSSSVSALAFTGADLYAGAGAVVRRWNGQVWSFVGETDGEVLALAVDTANHLLVGGSFRTATVASPYFVRVNLPTGPDISLFEDGDPDELINGQTAAVSFGSVAPGAEMIKTFSLRNDGVASLSVTALKLPAGFTQAGAGVPVTLAAGAAATFQVRFTGGEAVGDYPGTMALESNDADEATFSIPVMGRIISTLTPRQNWRKQYFGITTNTGDAADDADPDHDGIPNLLEWACHLDPAVAGRLPVSFTPGVSGPGAAYEFIYTRSVVAAGSGMVYAVEWSGALSGEAGAWSVQGVTESILSDDGTTQQVKALIPGGGQNRRFVHLRVTSPD